MAAGAPELLENCLAAARLIVEGIWIGRRLQRIDVQGKRIELLIAETGAVFTDAILRFAGLEFSVARNDIQPVVGNDITHQIADRAMTHEAGCIKIPDIL